MALPESDNAKHIHATCFQHIAGNQRIGVSPEPKRCDCCRADIRGELMWRIESDVEMGWAFPFIYLCTLCADSFVYGE